MPTEDTFLPADSAAERALLATQITWPDSIRAISEQVHPEFYYYPEHKRLAKTLIALDVDVGSKKIDDLTIARRYQEINGSGTDADQDLGILAWIGTIYVNLPDPSNWREWAEIVRRLAALRALHSAADVARIQCMRHSDKDTVGQVADSLKRAVENALELCVSPAEYVDALTVLEELDNEPPDAFSTGLRDLDALLDGGFRPGELVGIAGRPSMGKSSLALYIALKMARHGEVLFESLEMRHRELASRMLAMASGVPLSTVRKKGYSSAERSKIVKAHEVLHRSGIRFFEGRRESADAIAARVRTAARKAGKLRAIVVDFLTLLELPNQGHRHVEVNDACKRLKDLGAEFGVPMILLAQLNREQTRRTSDHRPRISDLREAGEEVMDIGLLVHRPGKYMKRPPEHEKEKLGEYRAAQRAAELIVDKNRNGNTGIVGVSFFGETQRWHDLPNTAIFN